MKLSTVACALELWSWGYAIGRAYELSCGSRELMYPLPLPPPATFQGPIRLWKRIQQSHPVSLAAGVSPRPGGRMRVEPHAASHISLELQGEARRLRTAGDDQGLVGE